jgi:integrase
MDKQQYTEWHDAAGRRVKPGTPGAKKVHRESSRWYAFWRVGGRVKRAPLATDKAASKAMLAELIRNLERGLAGLTDPHQQHQGAQLAELVEEYLAVKLAEGLRETSFRERRRILAAALAAAKWKTLADLTADKIDRYLLGKVKSGVSGRTVLAHRVALSDLCKWLTRTRRIGANPMAVVFKPNKLKSVRPWRALTADDLARLLTAAAARPLAAAKVNRGGRNARQQPGRTHAADLTPDTVARLEGEGRERALLYKVAALTGYRRRELLQLKVHHLRLDDARPTIRQTETKGGEKAVIPIPPALAAELRQHVAGLPADAPVFGVGPDLSKVFGRDRAFAKIPQRDAAGKYAVFHSLRKSAATLMIMMGVAPKEAQSFLRHSDIRLTLDTYTDGEIVGMDAAAAAMEAAYAKLTPPAPPPAD